MEGIELIIVDFLTPENAAKNFVLKLSADMIPEI